MNDAGRICFVLKGDYDPSAQYDFLDVVQFGNATYAAKKNTLGSQPEDGSESWQLIAKGIEIHRVNALPETDIDASVIYALMDKNGDKAALYQYDDLDGVWVQYGGTGDADFIEITHDEYESLPPEEKADGKARFIYNVPNTGQVIMLNNKKYSGTAFTGTNEEFEAALAAGKIESGTIVNITDDYQEGGITVDSELSETSENPVQNKTVTIAIKNILSFMPKGAASHNGIFRGKDLTNIYTIDEMCDMISRGTFDDLYIGDYFDTTIHSIYTASEVVRNVFAVFNPYLNNGDMPFEQNHAGIVTKNCLTAMHSMNSTNTTEGGFIGSDMWQTVLPVYADAFQEALGGNLLTHRSLLTNSVNTDLDSMAGAGFKGASNNLEWTDTKINLLSEIQVFGNNAFSSSCYDTGCDNLQLPLFALDPTAKVCGRGGNGEGSERKRQWYWFKSVSSVTRFSSIGSTGDSNCANASSAAGVRLLFCIG